MKKIINYDSSATEGLRAGANKLANAVKVTLGPSGRNVIIAKPFIPSVITKDGVTVAKDNNSPHKIYYKKLMAALYIHNAYMILFRSTHFLR